MDMHLSHYLHIFPMADGSRHLLYSTRNSALALLSDSDLAALKQGDFSLKVAAGLRELGMVVDDLDAERRQVLAMVDEINAQASNLYLDIILGMDCNFRCTYCYEGSMKGRHGMSDATAEQLVEYVSGLVQQGKEGVSVTFYGGEPLLYGNRLKSLSASLQRAVRQQGADFEFSLITNGSLLKPELVKELLPLGLKAAKVTLDGPPDIHNGNRPFGSGQPSFATIVDNVLSCADLLTIHIGANFSADNHNRFAELIDLLNDAGLGPERIGQIRFAPIMEQQGDVGEGGFRQGCVTLNEAWLAQAQVVLRGKAMAAGYAVPEQHLGPCKVLRDDHLTIHYDGTLCKCPVLIGRSDYVIGDIWQGGRDMRNYYPDNWQRHKKCRTCIYLPLCFGGCRYLALLRDGHMKDVDCLQTSLDSTLGHFVRQDVRYRHGIPAQ